MQNDQSWLYLKVIFESEIDKNERHVDIFGKKNSGEKKQCHCLKSKLAWAHSRKLHGHGVAGGELARGAVVQHTEAVISGLDLVWHYENPGQRSRACCSKRRTGFLSNATLSVLNKQNNNLIFPQRDLQLFMGVNLKKINNY